MHNIESTIEIQSDEIPEHLFDQENLYSPHEFRNFQRDVEILRTATEPVDVVQQMRERSESEGRFLRDDVLPLWVRAKEWPQADQGVEQNGRYIPSSQSEHAPGGSPTQTHTTKDDEPAVGIKAWLDHLMGELRRLDAARPEEIRGCGEPEMRQIFAECPFGNPPSAYVGFMRRVSGGCPRRWRAYGSRRGNHRAG